MATLNSNQSGYNTYIIGSSKYILNCLRILVYNKEESPEIEKISLYNIERVKESIIKEGKYLSIDRLDKTEPFVFKKNNGKISGFDVIIYINTSDGSSIGYTEFISIQGENRDINITLDFTTKISGDLDIEILNSLSQVRGNSLINRDFSGDDLEDYTKAPEIFSYKDDIPDYRLHPKYSNHLTALPEGKNILLDYSLVNNNTFTRFNMSKKINIDIYDVGFNNFQLGYYTNQDIVIYSWTGLKYNIYSLTTTNKFGNAITYTPSNYGYLEIPKLERDDNINLEILYFSGEYAIVKRTESEGFYLYNTKESTWVNTSPSYFLIDQWNPKVLIKYGQRVLNYNNIYNYYPEIQNTFFNLKEYSKTNNILVEKQIGEWYIIRQKGLTNNNLLIYTNLTKTLIVQDTEKVIPINNNIVMILSKDLDNNTYYSLYTGEGETFYSEKARNQVEGGVLEYREDLGCFFCNSTDSNNTYENYYRKGFIRIVKAGTKITRSHFRRYRKNIITEDSIHVPEIIGSLSGILFYKKDGYIDYL